MITPIKKSQQPAFPVNRNIFGHFIESGFGRQVPGMWAEMIYNRAFRKVAPYSFYTWEWLGMEEPMYNENAPFWHNGYEEHDWEEIGDVTQTDTHGSNTFKGKRSLRLGGNKEEEHGLRQRRIWVDANRDYTFQVFAGVQGKHRLAGLDGFEGHDHTGADRPFTIRFRAEDGRIAFEKTITLTPVQGQQEIAVRFTASGWVDLELVFDWKGTVLLSWVSMMPNDNQKGWRKDVVALMKKANVPLVRFPGGCFVSFFDWESSIGPRDRREPMESYYWGGLEENDVGLDEFMDLAEMVGFEPQVCFNMMSSYPFKARQMVEYLNAPSDVGMGRLRMLNGHKEPRKVKFFEMDNEPWRKWSPVQYAHACVEFAEEMRLADPDIQLMMACYGYPTEALRDMLDVAGGTINYIIYRQGDPKFVAEVMEILRAYNKDSGNQVKLVNTEWLPSCKTKIPFEDPTVPMDFDWGRDRITNDYHRCFGFFQPRWFYALNGAARLLDYMSYGGEFASANFNNCCNTWGQNIINASKQTAWLSCAGEMFAFLSEYFIEGMAVNYDSGKEGLSVQGIDRPEGRRLFLVNNTGEPLTVAVEGSWRGEELSASGQLVQITQEENPLVRKPVEASSEISLSPWSIVALKSE